MQSALARPFRCTVVASLAEVPPAQWNSLAGEDPFLRYEFLNALRETGCVGAQTGWDPQFPVLYEGSDLVAAMPLYGKSHSYGEYVFDWAWADAYRRHGLRYYPKLISAIPFTPASGPRLLAKTRAHRDLLLQTALDFAAAEKIPSLHILFPCDQQANELQTLGLLLRHGVQFHWRNRDYESFDHFLSHLTHDKRKKIRAERRRVQEARISFRRLSGHEATLEDWRFFNRCYRNTYGEHGSMPYLNLDFFSRIGQTMPDNMLLVVAEKDGRPIAGAFNIYNASRLYGRYWGALQHVPALHFETCYYQAIEFCIERGIAVFEGGAQGEHKVARGFHAVRTWSAHWLSDPRFAAAIGNFLNDEARRVHRYIAELEQHSPFKSM